MSSLNCDRCGHTGGHAPGPVLDHARAVVEGGSSVWRRAEGEGPCAGQCSECRRTDQPQRR
jgi:hypothetical protein